MSFGAFDVAWTPPPTAIRSRQNSLTLNGQKDCYLLTKQQFQQWPEQEGTNQEEGTFQHCPHLQRWKGALTPKHKEKNVTALPEHIVALPDGLPFKLRAKVSILGLTIQSDAQPLDQGTFANVCPGTCANTNVAVKRYYKSEGRVKRTLGLSLCQR